MWEVLTFGAKPYGKKKAQEVLSGIEKGERLPQPATSSIELYKNLLKCEPKTGLWSGTIMQSVGVYTSTACLSSSYVCHNAQ